LARLVGVIHNISYYAPEMKAFSDVGLPEYWRAYIAYRSAPLGVVPAGVVAATFYNFAPRVVASAIPSAWEGVSPAEAIELRDRCVERALVRAWGDEIASAELAEAAELAWRAIDGCEGGARPLYAAHGELPVPEEPHRLLWHACTLWREHRGDGHNIALAAERIDGVECHVLLAAKGVVDREVIEKIRGWGSQEWDDAMERLRERSLLDARGGFTTGGRALRNAIEDRTDELCREPRDRLGPDGTGRLIELLSPLVDRLVASGSVAGTWPPPIETAPRDG
jgi:hypothetical protein